MSEEAQNPVEESAIIIKKSVKAAAKEIIEDPATNVKKLIIQHNKPEFILPIYEPVQLKLSGVIDTPLRYLEKRAELIDHKDTTVQIDRDNMTIKLQANEKNHFTDLVGGSLEVHPDFRKFRINSGDQMTPEKLGDFLRMNRSVFETKSEGLTLVAKLKNFTANVNKIVEEKSANNGDRKKIMDQTVAHNLPSAFNIKIGLFKGQEAKVIEVEIVIDSHTLNCSLESPEANEFMDKVKNDAIDEQIAKIRSLAPDILIIEK